MMGTLSAVGEMCGSLEADSEDWSGFYGGMSRIWAAYGFYGGMSSIWADIHLQRTPYVALMI